MTHNKNRRPQTSFTLAGKIAGQDARVPRAFFALLFLLCLALPAAAPAIEEGVMVAQEMAGDGWLAQEVEIRFTEAERAGLKAEILIASLVLSEPRAEFREIRIRCPSLELTWRTLNCATAQVRVRYSPLDHGDFRASLTHNFLTSETRVKATDLRVAGGKLRVDAQLRSSGWRARIALERLTPAGVRKLAAGFAEVPELPELHGHMDGEVDARGDVRLNSVSAELRVSELTGGNESGTAAAENMRASFSLSASRSGSGWSCELSGASSAGQLYIHPVFVDFSEHALAGNLNLTQEGMTRWRLGFRLQQAGIGQTEGTASFGETGWTKPDALEVEIRQAQLPGAYLVYLQPFLVGTVADSLESIGSFDGKLQMRGGALQALQLSLKDLHVDDADNRFALYGVSADVDWDVQSSRQSLLSWQGGYGYQIGFGAARLDLVTEGNKLQITRPATIPILDGAMIVSKFAVRNAGRPDISIDFDGEILPIGMRSLTRALGWPPFSGSLSGTVPGMRYQEGVVTVDGQLTARVFDGTVTVDSLRLSDPLGVLPELQADVRLRGLDLAALTSAFSFGDIEGRLDGDVERLRMLGFTPVGFDARLYTPPGDRSRHRISQQAIENISDLGGAGASAVLSRGMLRFFESFAYDAIGWSCLLRDEVCRMDGVAPAQGGGYYIVRGKGLPRINVIGFSRRVSWPALVRKLQEISAGNAPEIR